jgi:hypothetical protein
MPDSALSTLETPPRSVEMQEADRGTRDLWKRAGLPDQPFPHADAAFGALMSCSYFRNGQDGIQTDPKQSHWAVSISSMHVRFGKFGCGMGAA